MGCAVGRTRISFTSTCGGCESAKSDRARDVIGHEGRLERDLLEERRVHHPGRDHRDAHARSVELEPGRLTHRVNRVLGRGVQRAGNVATPGDRAGEKQVSLGFLQCGYRRADRECRTVDVREHHASPLADGIREEAALAAEARVRPRCVEAAEVLERDGDRRLLVGPFGHVTFHGDGVVGTAELRRQRFELLDRAGREHEAPSLGREHPGGCGADPGRGAGDQDDGARIAHAPDSSDAAHATVGSGSAPQLAGVASTLPLLDANGQVTEGRRERHPLAVVDDESQRVHRVTAGGHASRDLGSLHSRREERPSPVEIEWDPAIGHGLDDLPSPAWRDPAELDAVR